MRKGSLNSGLFLENRLSLAYARASDTVSHQRLVHNLRRRKIPEWITDRVDSLLKDRSTTLAIHQKKRLRSLQYEQGYHKAHLYLLFYNVDLLEICDWPGTNTSAFGFADDVNILPHRKSTEENCKTLESEFIHKKCDKWASRYGAVFAPQKYELIHLSRSSKFNMMATVTLP